METREMCEACTIGSQFHSVCGYATGHDWGQASGQQHGTLAHPRPARMLVYDLQPQAVSHLVKEGSLGAVSRTDCLKTLNPPRMAWILVPTAFVDQTV